MMAHTRHTRYHHKKHYTFYRNGESVGTLIFDLKISDEARLEQLREFKGMCKADTCFLTWTALEGKCMEEIKL